MHCKDHEGHRDYLWRRAGQFEAPKCHRAVTSRATLIGRCWLADHGMDSDNSDTSEESSVLDRGAADARRMGALDLAGGAALLSAAGAWFTVEGSESVWNSECTLMREFAAAQDGVKSASRSIWLVPHVSGVQPYRRLLGVARGEARPRLGCAQSSAAMMNAS